ASTSLLLEVGMKDVEERLVANSQYLIEAIKSIDELDLITQDDEERLAGIVTFNHRHKESQELYKSLMANGVMCACRGGGIRFSPHFYTSNEIMDRALEYVIN
ncbi:MAG: aminotransferase class V-fold PLP-dependent enzyme, partial [Gammaproteobacteria bacterium]|nr:aminotransferase class V-fold PLP-dependent enzyme [Gammaproteobacteria bacterium]